VCFVLLYNFGSKTFLILRRIQRDIIINVHSSSCKVLVVIVMVSCDLNYILNIFSTNTKIPNFIKIRPAGGEMFHADIDRQTDRQTDMKKLIIAFRKFANESKIWCGISKSNWHDHCATSQKVSGSIPNGVIGIFH